jgi:hypothetical protein
MGRKAHQVGKGIWRAFVTHQELTTAELAQWSYPRGPQRANLWWIRRLAAKYADRVGRRWPGGIVWRRRDKGSGEDLT